MIGVRRMIARFPYLMGGLAVIAAMAGGAQAADTASGLEVARKLCVNCHIVEPDGAGATVNPAIPSFMAIADKEGQTESKLRGFVLNPHPPMPEVQLTTHELENIAAYIMSLKGKP
jgi:mono/diheme cytochrome c family protein